jgi:putative CocE/NonD family hydrolase
MGANVWRDEQEWPPARAQRLELYLSSRGKANTPAGDGRLNAKPPGASSKDEYRYDPRDPAPSLYGPALFTVAADQRPLASRQDILVYQTPPLTEGVEVTGNPEVELHASSSAPDTDFFVRLIDVAPDGAARDVSMGMVRARYRHSLEKAELLKPGAVTRFVIRMNATSNLFKAGHRIRLDVTSSDFPNYDRNHNTAADQNADAALKPADQVVHHGGAHVSKLILPRIP